ncbi:hypothetical protein [Mycoplasmoides pirum]|uniref:hypothetical protein n=1 Tax=Mycoplasmoides pirum TaxID=2122 RepID=UPI0004830758|nr:hypothetical protein [Mycoplasmoides pirum]
MINFLNKKKISLKKFSFIFAGIAILTSAIVFPVLNSNNKNSNSVVVNNQLLNNSSSTRKLDNPSLYLPKATLQNDYNYQFKIIGTSPIPSVSNPSSFNISFDRNRIVQTENTSANLGLYKKIGEVSYFNMHLNLPNAANLAPGNLYQFLDLKNNDKYVWEEGYHYSFSIMDSLVNLVLADKVFDINKYKDIYINFKQMGSSFFKNKDFHNLSNGTITYPAEGQVLLESVSTSSNISSTTINQRDEDLGNNKWKLHFSASQGINFQISLSSLNCEVLVEDQFTMKLYDYLQWVHDLVNKGLPISYGKANSMNDAIIMNSKYPSTYMFAEDFQNSDELLSYSNAINNYLGSQTPNPWIISNVYNVNDSRMDPKLQQLVSSVAQKYKIDNPYDNASGIFYKVVEVSNAICLGREYRKQPNPVPWLYYVADSNMITNSSNNRDGSYYLMKFETTGKVYNYSDVKYDVSSKKFYIDLSKFTNLKNKLSDWPLKIDLSYDQNSWLKELDFNSSEIVNLKLDINNTSNIPLKFSESGSNSVDSSISNELLKILSSLSPKVLLSANSITFGESTQNSISFNVPKVAPLSSLAQALEFSNDVKAGSISLNLGSSIINPSSPSINAVLTNSKTGQTLIQSLPFTIKFNNSSVQEDIEYISTSNVTNVITKFKADIEFQLYEVSSFFKEFLFVNPKNLSLNPYSELQNQFVNLLQGYLFSNFTNLFSQYFSQLGYFEKAGIDKLQLVNPLNSLFDRVPTSYEKPTFTLETSSKIYSYSGSSNNGVTDSAISQKTNDNSTIIIIGSVFGGIALIILLAFVISMYVKRKNAKNVYVVGNRPPLIPSPIRQTYLVDNKYNRYERPLHGQRIAGYLPPPMSQNSRDPYYDIY